MGIDLGRFRSNKDKDEWVDWLADDPVPASIRNKMRSQAVQQASRPIVRRVGESTTTPEVKKDSTAPATVSINISIPRFNLKKPTITIPPQLLNYRKQIIGGAAVLVLVSGVTTTLLMTRSDGKKSSDTPGVLSENDQKADFDYSLPKGNSEGLDGAVKFNAERKVVNFRDSIGGIAITISQQPLPAGFKEDTDAKVKKLAEEFSATKTIATANPTSYIGTSEKGPQTVIFSKKNLLVFIQSTKKIDDHDWAEYITNLK